MQHLKAELEKQRQETCSRDGSVASGMVAAQEMASQLVTAEKEVQAVQVAMKEADTVASEAKKAAEQQQKAMAEVEQVLEQQQKALDALKGEFAVAHETALQAKEIELLKEVIRKDALQQKIDA